MKITVLVIVLLLFSVSAYAKLVLVANSPDGAVTIELYDTPCKDLVSKEVMGMTLASIPTNAPRVFKEAKWIGHKDKKNYAGCWMEIPEAKGILLGFEDGDVMGLSKRSFIQPAKAAIDRYLRKHRMVQI